MSFNAVATFSIHRYCWSQTNTKAETGGAGKKLCATLAVVVRTGMLHYRVVDARGFKDPALCGSRGGVDDQAV
jgi:hypothetical protein